MPYTELSAESFGILLKLLNQKPPPLIHDVLLEVALIIRESCGCTPKSVYGEALIQGFKGRGPSDPGGVLRSLAGERLKLPPGTVKTLVSPVIHALFYEDTEAFLYQLKKALGWFFNSGKDPELLVRLFEEIAPMGIFPQDKTIPTLAYGTLFRMQEQQAIHTQYTKEQWNTILNSLKCELLGTRDRGSLVQSLARYLPEIGIATGAIVLYEDEKISVWVGSFSPQGIDPLREHRFPSGLLFPREVNRQYRQGVFMVQPLFIENQSLGYFIHEVPLYDGVLLEELRSAVSYALKGISLLEEVIRAKQIAEQAEQAKTALLQVLENELWDPLAEVMERLDQMEKKIPPEPAAGAILEALKGLKGFVASREAATGSFIDRTLCRINELSLRKTLFDLEELLPGIGVFPLLTGDVSRLSQCVSLIREEYPGAFTGTLHHGGLVLTFQGMGLTGTAWGKTQGLLLAERIVLLHGGEFYRDAVQCRILLPWTTLSGRKPLKQPGSPQDLVLALSDPSLRPANFFDLPVVQDIEQAAAFPGRTACIFWNTDAASAEDLVRVAALRHRTEFFEVPFLCYGKGLSEGKPLFDEPANPEPLTAYETILDAIERHIKRPRQGTILLVSIAPEIAHAWVGATEEMRISSMAAFHETVAEITPSLIALQGIDPAAAETIRRHPLTVMVPLVMVSDRIDRAGDVLSLCPYARILICNTMAALSPEFTHRIQALLRGDEMLPPYTGALVKKAVLYVNRHAESHISRWKLAESVHVSEDYLTRIFHREMGLSLWDYLNRYRVFLARDRLLQTNDTIQEIALCSGFQNQAYFCRVFKKIYGIPPGHIRKP
jgi:AraC-like DNA-binding protein